MEPNPEEPRVLSLRSRNIKVSDRKKSPETEKVLPKVTRRTIKVKKNVKRTKKPSGETFLTPTSKRSIDEVLHQNPADADRQGHQDSPLALKKSCKSGPSPLLTENFQKKISLSPISKRIDKLREGSVKVPNEPPISLNMIELKDISQDAAKKEDAKLPEGTGPPDSQTSTRNSDYDTTINRQKLNAAKERLKFLEAKWKKILNENDDPEDNKENDENAKISNNQEKPLSRPAHIDDEIAANLGKINLLLTNKFKWFEMLMHKVENKIEHDGKLMTTNDIDGSWSIIEAQGIDEMIEKFEILDKLRINNWESLPSECGHQKTGSKNSSSSKSTTLTDKPKNLPKKKLLSKKKVAAKPRIDIAALRKKAMMEKKENKESGVKDGVMIF